MVLSQGVPFNERLLRCIPVGSRDPKVYNEYNQLQIVTNLTHVPLRNLARYKLVPEQNAFYNNFLACSWKEYQYQTKQGLIIYEHIEAALKEALIQEVGDTGPGINLSKVEANKIIKLCKEVDGVTAGIKAVKTQNCIHKQIQHLAIL